MKCRSILLCGFALGPVFASMSRFTRDDGAATGGEGGAGGGGASPTPVPWGSPDGTFTIGDKPWMDALPEGPTRDLLQAKAYKNPQQLADAYFGINKLLSGVPGGVEALTKGDISAFVPKPDAPPEQVAEFYKRLGRPDNADAYELKFPEGVQADEGMTKFGKELAFKLGLNPTQAQAMADSWQEFAGSTNTQAADAARVANEAAVAEVTAKWNGEGNLNANVEAGKRTVQALGLDKASLESIESAMGAAPMLDLFARLGSISKEKGLTAGNPGGADGDVANLTPDQARAEIARLQNDQGFQAKYTDKNNGEHQAALRRMEQLFMRAG